MKRDMFETLKPLLFFPFKIFLMQERNEMKISFMKFVPKKS